MSGIVKITTTILTFGKDLVVLSFTVKLLPVPVDNNETGDYRWENLSVRNCLSVESSVDTHLFLTRTPVLLSAPVSPTHKDCCYERLCDRSAHYWAQYSWDRPLWGLTRYSPSKVNRKHPSSCFSSAFVSLTVLRLPPGLEAVWGEGGDHVLDGVADVVALLVVHLPGVAHKTFCLLMDRKCESVSSPYSWCARNSSWFINIKGHRTVFLGTVSCIERGSNGVKRLGKF